MVKVSRVATAVAEVTAVAGIQSLAWKPAYAEAEAKKKKKKIIIFSYWKGEFFPLDLFLFNV